MATAADIHGKIALAFPEAVVGVSMGAEDNKGTWEIQFADDASLDTRKAVAVMVEALDVRTLDEAVAPPKEPEPLKEGDATRDLARAVLAQAAELARVTALVDKLLKAS